MRIVQWHCLCTESPCQLCILVCASLLQTDVGLFGQARGEITFITFLHLTFCGCWRRVRRMHGEWDHCWFPLKLTAGRKQKSIAGAGISDAWVFMTGTFARWRMIGSLTVLSEASISGVRNNILPFYSCYYCSMHPSITIRLSCFQI